MNTALSYPVPYEGHFDGNRHVFAVRVYFEDTDFSGVVYHARYLHFMERARSDMLARAGINQRSAHASAEGAYAVTQMQLKYLRPARFDDAIVVTSIMQAVRGASIDIRQIITREEDVLVTADVTAAFVAPDGRARRQPKSWVAAFRAIMDRQDNINEGTA